MKLIIKNLKKNFEKKEVLKDINFEFEKGKIYGLLGRNGAGKTTFFNCLNEDLEIDNGEFCIEDNGKTRKIIPEDIGYVLSIPNVPEFLTGREFLKFFIEINKDKIKEIKAKYRLNNYRTHKIWRKKMGLSRKYDVYAYKELLAIIVPHRLLVKYKKMHQGK